MSFIDKWRHRARAFFRHEEVSRERREEFEFHLALESMHAQQQGMSPATAQMHARRAFGNVTGTMEAAHDVPRSEILDAIWQDLRYAFRALSKSPAFAVGAALILAIGVGATTSVFSIFDTLVRRGVPYPKAENLVLAFEQNDGNAFRGPSYLTFKDWVADSTTWKGPIEGMAYIRGYPNWIDGPDGAERSLVGSVTPGFFNIMGVKPLFGRTFSADEETRSGNRVVVLSYDAWRRYYGADDRILGRVITVDSSPTTVIGVMPKGFVFPNWSGSRTGNTSMWTPIAHIETKDPSLMKRGDRADLRVVARLRSQIDTTQARVAMAAVASRIAAAYPAESKDWTSVAFLSVRSTSIGGTQQLLTALGGAVGLILLLACANVANLTFVRGASRMRELAIRTALGAGRARVIRQLMTESVVIAVVGCAAGLAIAATTIALLRRYAVDQLAGAENLELNTVAVLFAIGTALFASLASAVVPAFRASRTSPSSAMNSESRSSTSSRHDGRIRSGLVVLQLALAVVLLVGTGLFVTSLRNITGVPLGFDPNNLIATAVTPPPKYATAEQALSLYQNVIEKARAIPGVTDVGFVNHAPLGFGGMPTTVAVEGREIADNIGSNSAPFYRTVSAGYLKTMGMEVSSGRWFTDEDMRTRDGFVVNETLAKQLFPNESAIGKRLIALRAARPRPDFGQPVHGVVIGVVKDVHSTAQAVAAQPEIYVPFTLETWHWGTLVVRTNDVAKTLPLVRGVLSEVDPTIPEAKAASAFNGAGAMLDRLTATLAQQKLLLATVAVFAVAALLLAAIGLYSVVSYGVSQRTREVGVRVALGATDRLIVKLIVGEGTMLAALGVVIGCIGAFVLTRFIQSLLFNTPRLDIRTYVVTGIVLLITAELACYLPARRASKLSPVEAIRGD